MSLKRTVPFFIAYLRPQWPHLIALGGVLLATVSIQLGNPQLLRAFIDTAASGGTLSTLLWMGALFVSLGLLNQGLVVLIAYVSGNLAWRITNLIRSDLVRHCLSLDMAFHNLHSTGELIERIDEDVNALSNLFSAFVLQVLINVLFLLGVLVIFFFIMWWLGLIMTVFTLISLLVLKRTRQMLVPTWVKVTQAKADLHGFFGEHVAGIADIRTSNAVPYSISRFLVQRGKAFQAYWYAHRLSTIVTGGTDLLLIAGTAGAFLLSIALFQMHTITLGTVFLITIYMQLLMTPLQSVIDQVDEFQQAQGSLIRIQELFKEESSLKDGHLTSLPPGPLAVELDDVSFSYQPENMILEHITLRIEPGTSLGLLGRTGSGKTTLARLLFRLCDPTCGALRVGGVDLREMQMSALRRHIGMVTQEVQLFHASLRDNLTFFDRGISDDQIVQVLEELGLASWYNSLSHGLDTRISSGTSEGAGFSAGEAQLLALARVFLQKPSLVILDEASSRLDPLTEGLIDGMLDRLLQNCTVLIIAHRLTTLKRSTTIAVLDEGKLLEYGSREALMQDGNSHFHRLLQIG